MSRLETRLNKEHSQNCSGILLNEGIIPVLKENHYYIENLSLDGDAPKQFIRAYFYEEGSRVRKSSLDSWIPFIAKTAEKWYPHESVIEYMINRIGLVLGLGMNEVRLVKANGQIRFLSRYFLNKNERLVHGAEICGEHLNDTDFAKEIAENKNTARELFTFEFIRNSIQSVYPNFCDIIVKDLVKMIGFDAIVGNNDRHFYNWGVVDNLRKTQKKPKFAPIFDSARGLLWNTSDENVIKHYQNLNIGGKKVVNYVEKAYPRVSIEQNKEANHFELIQFIKQDNIGYKHAIDQLASVENEIRVLKMLQKEFYPFFIRERSELITLILKMRFKKVREV